MAVFITILSISVLRIILSEVTLPALSFSIEIRA